MSQEEGEEVLWGTWEFQARSTHPALYQSFLLDPLSCPFSRFPGVNGGLCAASHDLQREFFYFFPGLLLVFPQVVNPLAQVITGIVRADPIRVQWLSEGVTLIDRPAGATHWLGTSSARPNPPTEVQGC